MELSALEERFNEEGIAVLGISADDREDTVEFAKDKGIRVTLMRS